MAKRHVNSAASAWIAQEWAEKAAREKKAEEELLGAVARARKAIAHGGMGDVSLCDLQLLVDAVERSAK